jgi:small subunit ribosomal protein S20
VDSQAKTNIARAEKLITAGDAKATQGAVKRAISYLDKAAGKKVLHPNSAARRKSRLLKKINKAASKTKSEKAA